MRRRSKASWAAGVIAPWFLGMGLLVSFTASAGQDSASDWNVAPLTARARADGGDASTAEALAGDIGLYGQDHGQDRGLLQTARLNVGEPQDLRSIPDEREPHVELKPNAKGFPQVDRTRKGDPVVAIRPSLETRLPRPAALGVLEVAKLSFRIFGTTTAVALAPRVALPGAENSSREPRGQTTGRTTGRCAGNDATSLHGRLARAERHGGHPRRHRGCQGARGPWRDDAGLARHRARLLDPGAARRDANRGSILPALDAGSVGRRQAVERPL